MPPISDLNRSFYKALFKGEKEVLKVNQVNMINVPKVAELKVRTMLDSLDKVPLILNYLPDNFKKRRTIDRTWFFNVLNTVYPGYLE